MSLQKSKMEGARGKNVAPPAAAPEKRRGNVPKQPPVESVRVERHVHTFFQQPRDTIQSTNASRRKSPVKSPTPPPEPEDEFLFLEDDDVPLRFSIPKSKPGRQTGKQKMKKNEVTEPDDDEEQLPSPEDPPEDLTEEMKPKEKKRRGNPTVKVDHIALSSNTLKDAKTRRAVRLKSSQKVPQGSGGESVEATMRQARKRKRRAPRSWCDDICEGVCCQPQQQEPSPQIERKKPIRCARPPRKGHTAGLPETSAHSSVPLLYSFSSTPQTPPAGRGQQQRRKVPERPAEEVPTAERTVFSPPQLEVPLWYSQARSSPLSSGPASSLIRQTSRAQAALSVSDLYSPPLKPLILKPVDKANLAVWLKNHWVVPVKAESLLQELNQTQRRSGVIPDQFEWFSYKGRAIGFMVDIDCGSFCNGKMVLGSFMKKPLWVDHSAVSVFNLFTGSVSVTINGLESSFNPGEAFMVPCGSAYSIHNLMAQPAILYFNRMMAESSN